MVAVAATLVAVVGCRSLETSTSHADPGLDAKPSVHRSLGRVPPVPGPPAPGQGLGINDGAIPEGVTVFDDGYPAVARLDPALLETIRRAASDADDDGVELVVNSGWRSAAYQEHLLAEAISEHGSQAEAARWVASPATSPHVSGEAIDVGGDDAAAWLAERGRRYGLCQIYANEPWHFELRTDAVDQGCPPVYADPTQDPRMQS